MQLSKKSNPCLTEYIAVGQGIFNVYYNNFLLIMQFFALLYIPTYSLYALSSLAPAMLSSYLLYLHPRARHKADPVQKAEDPGTHQSI